MNRPDPRHTDDQFDAAFIKSVRLLLGFFYDRYFRVGFHGIKSVPEKPVLFVGNHNGIIGLELFMILEGWIRHKPLKASHVLALAHDIVFTHSILRTFVPKLGAIPAKAESAGEAFEKGYSVLVYPGGDRDIFRPYSKRANVDFGGRKGYAELALKHGVPIVPVANVGGHETAIVLHRSDWIAKKLDFKKKYRMSGLPITLRGLPFMPGLLFKKTENAAVNAMIGLAALPLPAKMDFYFEPAITLSKEQREKLSFESQVEALDRMTLDAIESRLQREYAKPRWPVLGPI